MDNIKKEIDLEDIAKQVENKMLYMCGCRNCIDAVLDIIKGETKPRKSQCAICWQFQTCNKRV